MKSKSMIKCKDCIPAKVHVNNNLVYILLDINHFTLISSFSKSQLPLNELVRFGYLKFSFHKENVTCPFDVDVGETGVVVAVVTSFAVVLVLSGI